MPNTIRPFLNPELDVINGYESRYEEGQMYGTEEMRIAVLKAYIDGADYDSRHDRFVIGELKNAGYLRCGVNPLTDAETIRTTSFGELYLRNNGHCIRRPFIRRFVNRVKRI